MMKLSCQVQGISARAVAAIRICMMAVLAGLIMVGSARAQESDDAAAKVEATRDMLEKWVESRRLISKEKQDWALGKEILSDRIELIQQEINSLKEKIAEAEKSLSELDKQRIELNDEFKKLDGAGKVLVSAVSPLEKRVNELLGGVPAPLQEKVEPLSRRFPKPEDKEIKLSLSERFQNVVGVLNEVNKFNSEISLASEMRDLGNGKTAEVTSLYIGISQGYYSNKDGTAGGAGHAQGGQWIWRPKNDSAANILKAVKIMNNEDPAGYVKLPFEIK